MTLVELPVGGKEFEKIASYITKSYKNACILSIERIDNHPLEAANAALKESMPMPNEQTLFHGTTAEVAHTIVECGYDPSYAKRCVYGKGIYFAQKAAYSFAYMDVGYTPTGFELSYMFVNSVLVGRSIEGRGDRDCDLTYADSQVDRINEPLIVSIPRAEQALPKYLITFHKNAPH